MEFMSKYHTKSIFFPFLMFLGIFGTPMNSQENMGIDENRITFGQSAAFTGPAGELGKAMRLGILAAFEEVNSIGGVHGREVHLVHLDDVYEPDRAVSNTRELIENQNVFAIIGEVGTPTSRAVVNISEEAGVPFIAPFTGAGFLRDSTRFKTVINIRASYQQEINEMIERLTQDRRISRIAVLYQNDSFGRVGYNGAINALKIYGLQLIGRSVYPRNTTAVKTALYDLMIKNPEAIIVVGAYDPVATAIKWAHKVDFQPIFMTISFVGGNALASSLGEQDFPDVYMTQVVPDFLATNSEVALQYREAIATFHPGESYGFGSFEGYLAARVTIEALKQCGREIDRDCFLNKFNQTNEITVGDMDFYFGEFDNQGSDEVFLTQFVPEEGFVPVRSLLDNPQGNQ
ncbi:MAG: ABC transporter substrate-binding protein [Rhodobacteraceae bacterium]|nr:ABC transporter substrate-binding protein [Paracoccaceae bacterium]MYF46606.1 ABC transporter substrate-binding protein [Paracoccaceae bacterium]MYG09786.1 ABC transporter substrate-binding protein [Paracoccaceae bacterium]MYI92572.1 ABC transporter substrate-binding protein [Paracoccaceae bacterium]